MSLDPYLLCPCGGGKKLKFCCSKDILPELEKVVRALEGEQFALAYELVSELVRKRGPRPALLTIKAQLELDTENTDDPQATIEELLKLEPYNATATALNARLALMASDIDLAAERLQRAIEYSENEIAPLVYQLVGVIAESLFESGRYAAARAHWDLQIGISQGEDQRPIRFVSRLMQADDISLVLRRPFRRDVEVTDVPWAGEFRAAMVSAQRGAWLAACESLASLADKVGEQTIILQNTAILRTWLGHDQAAAALWLRYSERDDVSHEQRVEAAWLHNLLFPWEDVETIELVRVEFPITDSNRVTEALLSDQRAVQSEVERSEDDDQPPPKAVFELLDRPRGVYDESLTPDQVPRALGDLRVYGKQTDREARVELMTFKNAEFDTAKTILREIGGEWLGEPTEEQKLGEIPSIAQELQLRWLFPANTPATRQAELVRQKQQDLLLNRWPELSRPELGGLTPAAAANDPAYRLRLEAAVLSIEDAQNFDKDAFDVDALRDKLALPRIELLEVAVGNITELPLLIILRLDPTKLPDEQLALVFSMFAMYAVHGLVRPFGREILRRNLAEQVAPREVVYHSLFVAERGVEAKLAMAVEAREAMVAAGKSPAPWLLREVPLRLQLGDFDQANTILQTLQRRHMEEPGIAEQLYRLLMQLGLITPDGRPRQPSGAVAASPAGTPPAGTLPAGPAPSTASQPGKLWTPDQGEGGEQPKSKLWLPD